MQINFTGIKNIRSTRIMSPDNNMEAVVINAQLTDDYDGKDLSNFKETLSRSGVKENYLNPVNQNFVNIIGQKVLTENGIDTKIILNNTPLPAKRNTVPLFSFLAKLTRDIKAKPDEKFVVNKDYLESDDFNEGIILGYKLSELCGDALSIMVPAIINPPQVKHCADSVNNIVQDIMVDYLA